MNSQQPPVPYWEIGEFVTLRADPLKTPRLVVGYHVRTLNVNRLLVPSVTRYDLAFKNEESDHSWMAIESIEFNECSRAGGTEEAKPAPNDPEPEQPQKIRLHERLILKAICRMLNLKESRSKQAKTHIFFSTVDVLGTTGYNRETVYDAFRALRVAELIMLDTEESQTQEEAQFFVTPRGFIFNEQE